MAELIIERLGEAGDGVAPGPVFVPGVLPGERVEGAVKDGRMEAPRILTPSAMRVRAPCPHAGGCGGCRLQHASDAFMESWKVDRVRGALSGRGLDAPIRNIHTSPPESRRRATFAGRRTKKGAIVGFHGRASGTLIAVPDCRLVRPALRACLATLEALVRLGGSRKGEMSLALTDTPAGADLAVTGGKPLTLDLRQAIAAATADGPVARVTWEGERVVEHAPVRVDFAGIAVEPPPGAFLQATQGGQAALTGAVAEALAGTRGPVVDLFAGTGTFSLPLAKQAPVHAVEGEASLLDALEQAWRGAQGLRAITTETRDLFRNPILAEDMNRFSAAVIDPPRAGAEAQTRQICGSNLAQVAAVSCNPGTFARDAGLMVAAGFQIVWIDVVDQFRWSPHVELVALLTRPR